MTRKWGWSTAWEPEGETWGAPRDWQGIVFEGEMPWAISQKRVQQEINPAFEMYKNAGLPQ